jgi:hypothetical protein
MISVGMITYSISTGPGVFRTVFPFSEAMSWPNMLLAALTFEGVIGQLGIMLEHTILPKSFGDGYPAMPRVHHACFTPSYSRCMYPSRFSLTVSIPPSLLVITMTQLLLPW